MEKLNSTDVSLFDGPALALKNHSAQGYEKLFSSLPIIPKSLLRLGTKTHSSMMEPNCNPPDYAICDTDDTIDKKEKSRKL